MGEIEIKVAAMLGMEPTNDALRLRFRDPQNQDRRASYLTGPMLGSLTIALMQQAARLQGGIGQPMTLNSSPGFLLPMAALA